MIKMYMNVPYKIAIMIILAIIRRTKIRGRKLTYKEIKIIFILEFIVDINFISLGTITEPSPKLFGYIVLSVLYGILCYSTYELLEELKNYINQRDKEENEILTDRKRH